jgi:hypothetical protein
MVGPSTRQYADETQPWTVYRYQERGTKPSMDGAIALVAGAHSPLSERKEGRLGVNTLSPRYLSGLARGGSSQR